MALRTPWRQPRSSTMVLCKSIVVMTILLQVMVGLVDSLAPNMRTAKCQHWSVGTTTNKDDIHTTNNDDIHTPVLSDRRNLLKTMAAVAATAAPLAPGVASAGIDVSGLKVEQNPLDVFLGGTYYEDDESLGDGRISRRKYTIVETDTKQSLIGTQRETKKDFFQGLENRPVRILGESTTISSSRDDALELTGNLFLCDQGGCISIDFTPLGGPKDLKGYWDDKEKGIRFLDSPKVWSKQ